MLLTTQYLDEADRLADHIAIIDHGRLVASGTADELKAHAGRTSSRCTVARRTTMSRRWPPACSASEATIDARDRRRRHPPRDRRRRRTTSSAASGSSTALGVSLADIALRRPTLDDVFLALTGAPPNPQPDSRPNESRHDRITTPDRIHDPVAPTGTAELRHHRHARSPGEHGVQAGPHPQVLGIAVVQSVLFLLMFRYVIGGAIGVPGVSYVDFLVPGFVVSGLLFTGGRSRGRGRRGRGGGVYDRFRSLPIPDLAVLAGRSLADTAPDVLRRRSSRSSSASSSGSAPTWRPPICSLALVAPARCSRSRSAGVFVLASAWPRATPRPRRASASSGCPSRSCPARSCRSTPCRGPLQVFATYQPMSFMVDATRGLLLGPSFTNTLDHDLSWYVVGSLLWSAVLVVAFALLALRRYRRS